MRTCVHTATGGAAESSAGLCMALPKDQGKGLCVCLLSVIPEYLPSSIFYFNPLPARTGVLELSPVSNKAEMPFR